MRLRQKITVTTLAIALLPFIAAMTIALLNNSKQVESLTIETVQERLETGAEAISGYFAARTAEIAAYADMPLTKTMDWQEIGPYLRSQIQRQKGIYEKLLLGRLDSYYYVTAGGNPAQAGLATFDDSDPEAKPKSIAQRPYWQITTAANIAKEQTVYISDPMISYTTGVRQVMVAAGITGQNGDPAGMIGGAIEWGEIESRINAIRKRVLKDMAPGCKLFLVSADGVYIYHWDPEKVVHMVLDEQGKPLINEIGEKVVRKTSVTKEPAPELAKAGNLMIAGKSGTVFYDDDSSGEEMTVTFAPVRSARYSIALVLPKSEIMAPVNRLRWYLIIIMAATVVIVLMVSILIGRHIAVPIIALRNAASAIAEGNRHTPITRKSTDEVGELTDTFNTMLATLQQRADLLARSESRFRAVAENASSAIITADVDGKIVFWNRTAEKMFGYSADEILAKPLTMIMPERYHHAHKKGLERVANKGKTRITGKIVELDGLKKDGTEFPLDLSLSMWEIEDRLFFTALINDVTSRKEAEEQIVKLAKFPEENPNPVLRVSADGKIIYHNNASRKILQHWHCTGDDLVPDAYWQHIRQALDSNRPLRVETDCGNTVYSLTCAPVVESECVNLYALDITDRKRSEEMLSASEHRFRTLVENVPGAVYRSHIESPWIFDHISEAIFAVTGCHAEQFMQGGLSIGDLIIPEDIERVIRVVDEGVKSRSPFTVEYGVRHKDGSVRYVLERGRAAFDNNGNPLWLDGVILDTTDRWLAQTERRRLMKTLETRNRELQDIVYVASHDLKSPLVNISGFGNELADQCTKLENLMTKTEVAESEKHDIERIINEEIPESLEYINAGTDKINMLINGLLQVSRVGSVEFKIELLDMNEIIARIIDTVGFQAKTKNISITADSLPACIGDSPKTNQVFTNLINNAIKYLDPERKGKIRISGTRQGDESIFCVADNGIGISPQHQHRVFEVFHRLNPNDSVGGEGLGLTIVMRIVDRQNGRIWLESELEKGSKFYVALPAS